MNVNCVVSRSGRLCDQTGKIYLETPLAWNNALAHAMRYTALDDAWAAADLTGIGVTGSFLRADGETVEPINGTVTGNVAEVILPPPCYVIPGHFKFTMHLTDQSGATRSVMWVEGTVERNTSTAQLDPGTPIPNISQAIGQANAAASAATSAASDANAAASAANNAAAAAQAVADGIADEVSDIDNKRQIYERDAVGILNLADGLTWYENRAIDQNGEYVDSSNFRASDQIAVPEAAYRIKYANVDGLTIGFAKYDADDNFVAVRLLTSTEQGIATWAIDTSDCSYIRVYIHKQMHVLSILPNVGTLNAKVSDLAAAVAGLPKIQYGKGTTASSTGILDVDFDTPFSEAPVVILTPRSGTNTDVANTARLVSVTASGFRCIAVSVYKPSGSQTVTTRPDPNRDIHWVAIGT